MDFTFGRFPNFDQDDIQRCPFLKNIGEPTNLSFSVSSAFSPIAARASGKGPIFEDAPSFETAFRLFHGYNGVVPLSGRSIRRPDQSPPPPQKNVLQFNPLAARAATISFSSALGFFGFDSWNSSRNSDEKGSEHEAICNEWLAKGNCPIAKSYRAVHRVLPLVAKTFQPPPGVKLRCPSAIVAARAALARTAFARNLRPQPLPAKILVMGFLGAAVNVPMGVWREHTEKFSPSWFAAIHAAVPFIAMLRKSVLMPKHAMVLTIAASFLGQAIGSRAERHRLKILAASLPPPPPPPPAEFSCDPASKQTGKTLEWTSLPIHVTVPS